MYNNINLLNNNNNLIEIRPNQQQTTSTSR